MKTTHHKLRVLIFPRVDLLPQVVLDSLVSHHRLFELLDPIADMLELVGQVFFLLHGFLQWQVRVRPWERRL